jgi:hypothetical protein
MRLFACRTVLTTATLVLGLTAGSKAQTSQPASPQSTTPVPAAPPAAPTQAFDKRNYLPACSTEKVNGNCFVNIDRRYPISMPTFQMHRGGHITVYVFHPFAFESLTLDPGTAQAFQATDQAAGLLNALSPTLSKSVTFGTTENALTAGLTIQHYAAMDELNLELAQSTAPVDDVKLAKEIRDQITQLNQILDQTVDQSLTPVKTYFEETKTIYAQIREIELAAPRPSADLNNTPLRLTGVPADTPNPWEDYSEWRRHMTEKLTKQGNDTTLLLARLPGPCQKPTDPVPAGPWSAAVRICNPATATTMPSANPLQIPAGYDDLRKQLMDNLAQLGPGKPDPNTYNNIQQLTTQLDLRHGRISTAITTATDLLPALVTKISTDMQGAYTNVVFAHDTVPSPVLVGVIPPPTSLDYPYPGERKILTPYKALGPQITFTVNAQNEIANSLFGLPSASQKQAVATITALFASPHFEVSAGAFFSWLPNPTFSNKTDVAVTKGVPAPVDVKLDMTKTVPPLIIPFTAANYRVSPEYDWIGGRRSAFYATLGIGLNPYNTQVEYAAGFSFSWRYLMFSPLYHLGHGIHLTQGEQVGQIWCQYGVAAGSTPPPCAGSPPSPSTTNFWRGAFALGISVRVPTTYSATNH